MNPLPLIKVVHDERRDCDRRAGQLHRRGDDSGKRGHGKGGNRHDVYEQHAVHGRDDLVAHIPAQHADGAGDERHVEELRHDRPSLTAGRKRNVPQLDQHDIDCVDADESEKSRHRRVAVRRPCRKKARARCVDDPGKSADEERDVGNVALRLIEGAEGIALRYHQDDADQGEQDEADRIERRTNPPHHPIHRQRQERHCRGHDRRAEGACRAGQLLSQEHEKTKAGKTGRAEEPGEKMAFAFEIEGSLTLAGQEQDGEGNGGDRVSDGGKIEGVHLGQRRRHHREHAAP